MSDDLLRLLSDDNVREIAKIVDNIGKYELSSDVVELLMAVKMISRLLNDNMIHDVAHAVAAVFKIIDALEGSQAIDILLRALQDPELDRNMGSKETGIYQLLKSFNDPSFRTGLAVIVELIKAIGRSASAYKLAERESTR
jgi:uncharacterized protein YjgD (DUF1641 family)